jgi:hypothetical protein
MNYGLSLPSRRTRGVILWCYDWSAVRASNLSLHHQVLGRGEGAPDFCSAGGRFWHTATSGQPDCRAPNGSDRESTGLGDGVISSTQLTHCGRRLCMAANRDHQFDGIGNSPIPGRLLAIRIRVTHALRSGRLRRLLSLIYDSEPQRSAADNDFARPTKTHDPNADERRADPQNIQTGKFNRPETGRSMRNSATR